MRLLEDQTKTWLREAGLRVPKGTRVRSPDEAEVAAMNLGGNVVVKALVPAGRRGKGGAVLRAGDNAAARNAAHELLGRTFDGYVVREAYVEEAIAIVRELYCAFLFTDDGPSIMLSAQGGVDIESTTRDGRGELVSHSIDPLVGVSPWRAVELWHEAGIRGPILRVLGDVTTALYALFVLGDCELLELNPLAIDSRGDIVIVGAMACIDAAGLVRQAQWQHVEQRVHLVAPPNPREHRVTTIDAEVPGPECRYVELEGNIGLLVGGGGAGLYQHDRMLAMGGHPANHSVTPPTGTDSRKLRTVIEAILDHPKICGLLVGFNFAQMARANIRVRTLLEVLDAKGIETARFPVVIRLFGAGEDEARAAVLPYKGIRYLPREATLDDGVRLIVDLTRSSAAIDGAR